MPRPPSHALRPTGPALSTPRRGSPLSARLRQIALVVALAGGALYLGYSVIGRDLHRGTHLAATHRSDSKGAPLPPSALAAASSAGPAAPSPPAAPVPTAGRGAPAADPVATALVAAARDHLARKVAPTGYSVEDLRANAGNHLDLVERGLDGHLALRAALVRHRARHPQLYGLSARPALSLDERKRAWNGDNVEVFLRAFAAPRDGEPEAGDIVVVERTRGSRKLVGVATDVADDRGHAQFVVLDPAERAAREVSVGQGYRLLRAWQLRAADVARARAALDLNAAPLGPTL